MEQNDLFSILDNQQLDTGLSDRTPATQEQNPVPTPKKVESYVTQAPKKLPNILAFAEEYKHEMWTSFKHRRDCMMQVGLFASYKNMGALPLDEITSLMIIDYRKYMQAHSGLKNGTINRHLSAISACFRFALEDLMLIPDRPKVKLLRAEEPDTRSFTREQVDELVRRHTDNGDTWLADMITLGCKTGMRRSEIINLPLGIIQWDIEKTRIWLPSEITKTNKGRWVSLNAKGAWDCALRLKESMKTQYSDRRFYDRWWDVKHAMGYGKCDWFKFHATRHTAATNMSKGNVNAMLVAKQLGHASIQTTMKYFHGDADTLNQATADL